MAILEPLDTSIRSTLVRVQSPVDPTIKTIQSPGACAAGSSFFWAMQLLPYQRREAMYALYSFCREVDDVIDGDALRPLKDVLLSDWRSEILHPLR